MLSVTITTADFAAASDYNRGDDCPLYHALKRTYPEIKEGITVGMYTVTIDFESYLIPQPWGFESPYLCYEIDQLIADAKEGKKVDSVTIELVEN